MSQEEIKKEENQEEACTGSCSSCSASCSSRKPSKEELLEPANKHSRIKRVIGVVSGKGGVGKSFVTSYLAVNMQRKGYQTAILDADVTGPSIPKSFGVHTKAKGNELGIFPEYSKNGTAMMSLNLLVDNEETPVVWRGPVIAATVKQFWTEVVWGNVDYMFVDMPPGTGDVPLTVFQSIPLDGIIIVTSPQELVSMIVKKAVNMANAMEIPILGIVENYSYVSCGNCGEKISVFGESHVEEIAKECGTKVLAKIPLDSVIASKVDQGAIEDLQGDWLAEAADFLEEVCPNEEVDKMAKLKKIAITTDENHTVFQHFGTCPTLTIYELAEGKIAGQKTISCGETGHEAMVDLLVKEQVEVLICGGIGVGAMEALMSHDIMVVPGQQGDIDEAVQAFLNGNLMDTNIPTCNHHEGDGSEGCGCGCSCH